MKRRARGLQTPGTWPSLVGGHDSTAYTSGRTPAEVLASLGWSPTAKEPGRCAGRRLRLFSTTTGFVAGVVGTVLAYQSTPLVSKLGHGLLAIWIGVLCGFW